MIQEIYKQLLKQKEFLNIIKTKEHNLAYFFTMIENGFEVMKNIEIKKFTKINVVQEWQVGLTDKNKNKIVPCIFNVYEEDGKIKTGPVKIEKPTDAFKKQNKKIKNFDLSKLKIPFEEALKKTFKLQKNKYSTHHPMRIIVILQNLEEGQVWNITFLSMSFETLNIRINSETGEILSDILGSLISNNKEIEKLKEKVNKKRKTIE